MKTFFKFSVPVLLFFVFASTLVRAQTWQFTGSMNEARRLFTTEVLNNGMILAIGGYDETNTAKASCELYDPSTGTWSYAAPLNVARAVHRSTKLSDGRIIVTGGEVGTGGDAIYPAQTDVVEIYDPSTNTWTPIGHMTIPRENHTATLLQNNTILITGGIGPNISILSSCEIFDPSSDSSYLVAPMLIVRHEHQAILLNTGQVLVTGGRDGGAASDYFNECEVYDPTANAWTAVGSMPQARMRAILVQFSDNTVLSAAGRDTPSSATPGSETLDPSAMSWSSTDAMKLPCVWTGSVLFPTDRCIATGGIIDAIWTNNQAVVTTSTCEWYDHANRLWYFAPQMNVARAEHEAQYFTVTSGTTTKQNILVAGGMVGNNDSTYTSSITKTAEILDVSSSAISAYIAHQPLTVSSQSNTTMSSIKILNDGTSSPVLSIVFPNTSQGELQMFDISGAKIADVSLTLSGSSSSLSLSQFARNSGVYLLRVMLGALSFTTKMIVTR
jgi:hypothetical protein